MSSRMRDAMEQEERVAGLVAWSSMAPSAQVNDEESGEDNNGDEVDPCVA